MYSNPHLALDCAIVSSFVTHVLGESANHQLSAASKHAERKRLFSRMCERCAAQNIGLEPLGWESTGGMTPETSSILDSLCRVADGRMGIISGTTRGKLSARISIDLQRGFHAACTLQRAQQAAGSGL